MRISDWSSDVCSSDLLTLTLLRQGEGSDQWRTQVEATQRIVAACCNEDTPADPALTTHVAEALGQVGHHADEAGVIAQPLTSRTPAAEDAPPSHTQLPLKLKARARLGEEPAQARRPSTPARTTARQESHAGQRACRAGTLV